MDRLERVPWWQCRRYWLGGLLALGFLLFSMLRANLSIIIVCMVKHPHPNSTSTPVLTSYNISGLANGSMVLTAPSQPGTCSKADDSSGLQSEQGEFEWDKQLQGILLGGYFWGYSSGFQIVGGWLSQRFGASKIIAFGMLPLAIGNILSPVAIRISPYLFLVIRIFYGVTTGVMFPSAPVFWSRWSPPHEWGRLLSSTYTGGEFGNALAFPVNGLLCKYGGWELSFYAVGAAGLVWCILWILFARDSPAQMPGISEAEKKYIESSIGEKVALPRNYKTPWRRILTSGPVWACVCCHTMANFFFYMLFTQGPTFLSEVMNFDIASNGLFSSLPFIALMLFIMPTGWMSDWLTAKNYLSLSAVRKLMNSIGMVIPAAFLLALAYLDCSERMAGVAILTAAVGAFAFCFSGHIINMADVAVMHSGTLMGLSNTMASFPGIIAPYVVAYITQQGTQEEWRTAFFIAIVMNVVGGVVFLLFSSGSPQPWALPASLTSTTSYPGPDKQGEERSLASEGEEEGEEEDSTHVFLEQKEGLPIDIKEPI